ncbi:MAG: hypothetical protein ACYC2U_00230 [Candidatus Amoebophilus sp.]
MEPFLLKLKAAMSSARPLLLTILGGACLWQLFISSALGGQDRRDTIVKLLGIVFFGALLMYSDHIFQWIEQTFK